MKQITHDRGRVCRTMRRYDRRPQRTYLRLDGDEVVMVMWWCVIVVVMVKMMVMCDGGGDGEDGGDVVVMVKMVMAMCRAARSSLMWYGAHSCPIAPPIFLLPSVIGCE